MLNPLVVTSLTLAISLSTSASAYVIDANLADWGVRQTGAATDWMPGTQTKAWMVEDQTGGLNTRLSPGYGGQAYDVEALYVDYNAQYLYLAMITGHNPLTPNSGGSYGAGDFAIDFGRDGSYEFGIATLGNGKLQGGVYSVTQWGSGLWGAANEGPTSITSGNLLGLAQMAYTTTGTNNMGVYAGDSHFMYEVRIPTSLFTVYWGQNDFNVHWTMNCANDSLRVSAPAQSVSEPGTLVLFPLGLIGMGWLARRRQSRSAP